MWGMDGDGAFRGTDACIAAGISYRQLDYWARTDLVRPSVMDANGSGTQRLYSAEDVWCLALVRQMLDAGLTLAVARRTVPKVRGIGALEGLLVVIADGEVVVCVDREEMLDALTHARSAWVFRPEPCVVRERPARSPLVV